MYVRRSLIILPVFGSKLRNFTFVRFPNHGNFHETSKEGSKNIEISLIKSNFNVNIFHLGKSSILHDCLGQKDKTKN